MSLDMSPIVTFTLDGAEVQARPGETIWDVARRLGTHIPHLCHKDVPDLRSDGNCRACVVEIKGSGCWPPPASGRRPTVWS